MVENLSIWQQKKVEICIKVADGKEKHKILE